MERLPTSENSLIVASMMLFCVVLTSGPGELHAGGAEEFAVATRLAESGQPEGFYRLGRVYELGREVDKDLFEAARQYTVAAEQGHAEAQFSLALILTSVVPDAPENERKSFNWFNSAARQNHPMAAYFLAMSYESGIGTAQSSNLAFTWYQRAANAGIPEAMNALAHMYATGSGTPIDLPNAYAWNEAAAANDYAPAKTYRAHLESQLTPEALTHAMNLASPLLDKFAPNRTPN